MPSTLSISNIILPCKILFGIPFLFSFCSQILWTLISVYRLFLVIRSVRGEPPPTRQMKTRITIFIPAAAFLLSLLSSCLTSYKSEPFLLYRLCMSSCLHLNADSEWVAIYYSMIPALILYLPAGMSYAAIFTLVHRASTRQNNHHPGMSNIMVTADPLSVMESNNDQYSSSSLHKRTLIHQHRNSLHQTSTSLITSSELVDPRTYNNKKRLSMSLPAGMNLLPRTCSSVNLQLTQIRSKLIRRNIISAKLSVLVMMLLFLAGVLLSITYNQVQAVQVLTSIHKNLTCYAFYIF